MDEFPDHERFLELNEIILNACKNDPARRYASAWDLHADLVVLANGKSVRRLKLLERRLSALKRIAGISALVLAVAGGICYEVYRGWRTTLEARQRQAGANVAYGTRALEAGDLLGALPYFVEALAVEQNDPDLAALHRLRFGCILAQCPKLVQLWSVGTQVETVGFSPDGRNVLAVEWGGQARVFDIATGRPASPRFGSADGVLRGAYSPDGIHVVTAGRDKTACVWTLPGGQKTLQLQHASEVRCARFSPDGSRIVTACADGIARIWDAKTGKLLLEIPGHTDVVLFATFSPDGRRIVTTSQDETARIADATTGRAIGGPLRHPTWVGYASFSPDGRKLATACFDHVARVWDVESGQQIPPDMSHRDGVSSVEFSPDGRLIVTAGLDRIARLWLAETHQPLTPNPILRHSDRVTHATFAGDGHRVVTACADGTVRVWDLAGGAVAPVATHDIFSQDRTRFLTITNGAAQVWDTLSGQAVSPLIKPQGLETAALNPNGVFVLTQSLAGTNAPRTEIWDAATGQKAGPPLALSNDARLPQPGRSATPGIARHERTNVGCSDGHVIGERGRSRGCDRLRRFQRRGNPGCHLEQQ